MASNKDQQINFDQCDDALPTHIYSRDVTILPSSLTNDPIAEASKKITTKNVVDYSWEERYTLGHLVSYHVHSKLVAYVLSISNNYMIRVINKENSSRCLIKEFSGEISDIAFSKSKIPYVASIDINGCVKINKVVISSELLECQLVLNISANLVELPPKIPKLCYSRVVWCSRSDADDVTTEIAESVGTNISLLLGIVHGATFEVLQVDTIESELSSNDKSYDARIDREDLKLISRSFQKQYAGSDNLSDLFLPYLCYTAPGEASWISSLAISSDAAAFAVALLNGDVHFFTLDGSSQSGLKEAYSWRPFENDAVWSLLFLDDCRPNTCTDSFWCHVVVGGAFNRQLKIFRCDKWDCVQTVTFHAPSLPYLMSAHLDQSSQFMIMSDVRRKALYILEIDSVDGGTTKLFKNVQELVLSQPLLSFEIQSVVSKATIDGSQEVVIKLFTITKNAFQKMYITYISKGNRLNEIAIFNDREYYKNSSVDRNGVCNSVLTQATLPGVSIQMTTSLDQVSSLLSPASSFQDPAIISTQMQKDFPCIKLSAEVPPDLQHLFNSVNTRQVDLPDDTRNGSGNESEDEASIDDAEMLDNERSSNKFIDEEEDEEDCRFPLPPSTANGNWDNERKSTINENINRENIDALLSRMEVMFSTQRQDINRLADSIREIREQGKCNCKEARQTWSEQASKEVVDGCQRAVAAQMAPSVREALDAVVPKMMGDISARLGEDVRKRISNIEPVMREFTNNLLHDKKFVSYIAGAVADAVEKPLRTAYVDMVRKELSPALGKSMEKLLSESRELFREVASTVCDNNKVVMRGIEERLLSVCESQQRSIIADVDGLVKKVLSDVAGSRLATTEALRQQGLQISAMGEALHAIKESITAGEARAYQMSHAISSMNISVSESNNFAVSEQKITRLLADKHYAAAIDLALSLTNLPILLDTCARVPSKKVLSLSNQKPSAIQSSSILALVQQLSRDFNSKLDLKIEYLFDAMLSLDTGDACIRGHVTKVLKGVSRRLQTHLEQDRDRRMPKRDSIEILLKLVNSHIDCRE